MFMSYNVELNYKIRYEVFTPDALFLRLSFMRHSQQLSVSLALGSLPQTSVQ